MEFIIQNSDNEYIISVYVKTNSKKQEILFPNKYNNYITVMLRSKPIQNRANRELIKLLKSRLKISSNQITILSGLKKPNKKIRLFFREKISKEDIRKKLVN
jgi:uncharacterized protein (TIGR00251 family)